MADVLTDLDNLISNLDLDKKVEINNAIAEVNECLDDEIFSTQDFDEVLCGLTSYEVACRVSYGNFNPMSPYFKFDGYGNLESIDFGSQVDLDINDVAKVYASDCKDFLPDEVKEFFDAINEA